MWGLEPPCTLCLKLTIFMWLYLIFIELQLSVSSKHGQVLGIGQGDVGQLGLGDNIVERKRPAFISEVDGIKFAEVECGGMHSVAVTDKGEVRFDLLQNSL